MTAKKRRTAVPPRSQRIAIGGHFPDEVRTRLHASDDTGAISHMTLPEEHHRLTLDQDAMILRLPALAAPQLYYDGILPVDRERAVDFAIDGEKLGAFHVAWLRKLAQSAYDPGEPVLLRLERASSAARQTATSAARGVDIGRLSLGVDFKGVLPWGLIDNRPFLRCVHGYGLCLWRLQRFGEAERVFDELLWLSPSDNLGVRFVLPHVQACEKWTSEGA